MENVTELPKRPRNATSSSLGDNPAKSGLADLAPLPSEQLAEILTNLGEIATAVGENVVHSKALTILSLLENVEAVLLETLPGGERFTHCEVCETPLGPYDNITDYRDDIYVCGECEPTNPQPK